ncbi:MAG: hemolysin III family protein [Acidobacteriota bacterium]
MGQRREWSLGEEVAHALTHGVGLVASLVGLVALVVAAAETRDPWRIVGCAIYGTTLVLMYTASTLYHSLSRTRARRVFRVLDHSAIFLLIAGTYTPFTLVNLRGPWGWTLLGVVWGVAVLGVTSKSVFGTRWPILSTTLYVVMGWSVLVAVRPVLTQIPPAGIAWLGAGGVAYTAGVAFFAWERLRYSHAIWHVFVLAGSVFHFVAVFLYAVGVGAPA